MKIKSKRGFTIVELIIVVAVIAILAAMLIPTFSELIRQSQEAKDTSLVRELNVALKMDTTTTKHETMYDAVKAAANNGIDLSKHKASASENLILWDSENDFFAYCKTNSDGYASINYIPEYKPAEQIKDEYKFWAVVNTVDSTSKYSQYLVGTDNVAAVTVVAGFDVGDNTGITSVTYNGGATAQSVKIRTNGLTDLTVDAENDTIYHYGKAGNVNVVKCAPDSFHVYGEVNGTITVKQGHIAVESGANVGSVVVPADVTGAVKVTNKGTLAVVNTEKAPSSANIAISNEGSIDISVGNAVIAGNKSSNEYTVSKKLTSDTHEITEGGFYDGTGITIASTGTSDDAQYALNIKTTEKVVISGVNLTGLRGVQLKYLNSGEFDFTLIDSTVKVSARGIQAWFNQEQQNKGAKITVNNCKFENTLVSNYDTFVNNDKSTGIILNGVDSAEVNINGTTIQGFSYSVQFNSVNRNVNSTLNISNSVLKGRAGVYIMNSENVKVNLDNTYVRGINTFKNATGNDNESFGMFVFETCANNTLAINNCVLEGYRGPAAEYNQEYIVDFKLDAENNKFLVMGASAVCENIYFTAENALPKICPMYKYRNENNIVSGSFTKASLFIHQGDNVTEYDWQSK